LSEKPSFRGFGICMDGSYAHQTDLEALACHIRETCDRDHLDKQNKLTEKLILAGHGMGILGTGMRGTVSDIDPCDLRQAGWGIIFADDPQSNDLRAQLEPLLMLRESQVGDNNRFRILIGELGWKGSSKSFFDLHHIRSGPIEPSKSLPYYLLLVGNPDQIPLSFQYRLAIQFAVGRIGFKNIADYGRYAMNVVKAETERGLKKDCDVAIFAPKNPNDIATSLVQRYLIEPILEKLKMVDGLSVSTYLEEKATKSNLGKILNTKTGARLLFTASHGMVCNPEKGNTLKYQGALICQDWQGPGKAVQRFQDVCFSGEDIGEDANLHGLVAFLFTCFGAGCPAQDNYAFLKKAEHDWAWRGGNYANQDFLTELPQRLLSQGALAVVGHVDKAWETSFMEAGGSRTGDYESLLLDLIKGKPLGLAMEFMNQRYAELGTKLSEELLLVDGGFREDYLALVELWLARNDARNYIILGDPAVRLQNEMADNLPEGISWQDWLATPAAVRDLLTGSRRHEE